MSSAVALNAEGYLDTSSNESFNKDEFKGIKDIFGGITINTDAEKCESNEDFERKLASSLEKFKQSGIRGVWLRISIENSTFIPIAVKHGFQFHHTYPTYIVLTHWLPKDEPNTLPSFATSYLGAGGLVINEKNQVLAVCERYNRKKHWKLPGGMVDRSEDIVEAVKREVLEETGVQTTFISLVCFRHMINFRFGCSDIYFICLLKPLTHEITMDAKEIADAQWMELDEYITSPLVNDSNRFIALAYKNNFQNNDNVVKIETKQIQVYPRGYICTCPARKSFTFYSSSWFELYHLHWNNQEESSTNQGCRANGTENSRELYITEFVITRDRGQEKTNCDGQRFK